MANKYIEGALRSYIIADENITTICGNRVYFLKAPDRVTKPYIYFFTVADSHDPMYFGKIMSGQRLIQFSCIAARNTTAIGLQLKLMERLQFASGTIQNFEIEQIKINNMRSRIDPDTNDYICDVDVIVEYYDL